MRKIKLLLIFVSFSAFIGCEPNDSSFPASGNPNIVLESNEIYGGPNKRFEIKASLNDDLGLRQVNIRIPELQLDKVISFTTNPLVKEYSLNYKFLVPEDKLLSDTFEIELLLTDVSGNTTSKKINLRLDGDFDAPKLTNLKPINGSVIFKNVDTKLLVSFTAEDVTGIDKLTVSCEALGINDVVTLNGEKIYQYSKSFSIPSDLKTYDILVTAKDNFLTPNEATTKVSVTVADGLTEMYLVDLPISSNLNRDAFGVPMRFHSKSGNLFTFKYYADTNNKKIYLLGQETSFEPNCFGLTADGALENSVASNPIILPNKGYYVVTVNAIDLTYSVTPYTPTKAPINLTSTPIFVQGDGFEGGGGWTGQPNTLPLMADSSNPYRIFRELKLTGGNIAMTPAGAGWSPFWRLDTFGVVPFNGGTNAIYAGVPAGTYIFTIDTELERSTLILK